MRTKIVSALMVMVLLAGVITGATFGIAAVGGGSVSKPGTESAVAGSGDNQLRIIKCDDKLTQEQVASQIKAEYLIENNGYSDDDEVVAIVQVAGDSLLDVYNDGATDAYSVGEYAASAAGKAKSGEIERKQSRVVSSLYEKGLISGVEYRYTTVMNGVAVKTVYGNLSAIEKVAGVTGAMLSDTYNKVEAQSVEDNVSYNPVDIYSTGIYKADSVSYTGKRTSVAILDSGFDKTHSVFAYQPDVPENELVIRQETVTKAIAATSDKDKLNAARLTAGLKTSDVWYSTKIPFSYDYADKDYDVFPYDSEHGTHVAGIIGGSDDVIRGIAPDTQLVLMKVFPDLDEGGKTEDILAALEDAVRLNVDAINMSLGSSCGFTREVDEEAINRVYDAIAESGISLITAASNSYSSSFGGAQGDTNFVTNPDSGTVGSPSTYAASLSVASISGTLSHFLVGNVSADGNDGQIFFYKESNSITAEENNFIQELIDRGELGANETKTFEYVTVPGVGLKVSFAQFGSKESKPLAGKIALVRRGTNTFEEKAALARDYGAAACIIYNNIDGDILMSMGKTDHVPTISISKDDGEILAQKSKGTITISANYAAGPFMSDFSSWGPTPSLELKPEITAHGGNIKSAIPGSYTDENGKTVYRYDELSGTSMATPNLCGIVVLIRQYLKDTYPDKTANEIKNMANQLMMSSAKIVKNEENNPYSPRKQGAGLADLYNTVNTKAYITVDGIDRTKLELGDDKNRTGVYTMNFNIVNLSNDTLTYNLSLDAMTESVSSSDPKHVAETPTMLDGTNFTLTATGEGSATGNAITVQPNGTVKLKLVYTVTEADKNYINSHFENGMYVEGFVKLDDVNEKAEGEKDIDLNVPFLAFYGDWTVAPMFDKTYYEVESEAHDAAIDDEDKIKADYYATTPYGSYMYNYLIPLGTYLYDINTAKYDEIPASEEHIAIGKNLGAIDGISNVYAGLLRGAKQMDFAITDKVTGETVWSHTDYNATKSYGYGNTPMPYHESLKLASKDQNFVNNREYTFSMNGKLDYGDGGVNTNKRNSFSFDFAYDEEAPIIRGATYEKTYDKTQKKDRYYINLTVYDNQYAMSITPILFTSSSSYTILSENPIPIYSQKGSNTVVRFEITDYLDAIYEDRLITSALAFSVDDYALNSNIFLCQLPGTQGEFKFTGDGTEDGSDLIILSCYEDEVIDLTKYLYTADKTVDENKDYLGHLVWTASNTDIIEVEEGIVKAKAVGRATVSVLERMELKQAVMIINVKARGQGSSEDNKITDASKAKLESLKFTGFTTTYAFARAAQTSEIGKTGEYNSLLAMNGVSLYPGEKFQLSYDFNPWYAESKYDLNYESSNEEILKVDNEGNVTALAEGSATVTLVATDKATGRASNIRATLTVTVKNPFIIENRTLVAYKGLGGDVVIPDDEGILYIDSFAFCLYTTDRNVQLTEDDYDANKIPESNKTITSVTIPEGVQEIRKYAFYNCEKLEKVTLPESLKYIREYAFYGDKKIKTVDLKKDTIVIGANAFRGCTSLESIDLSKVYAIGDSAFRGCTSLTSVDLTTLRNSGSQIFSGASNLKNITMTEHTRLAYAMFAGTAIETLDLYERIEVPQFCFANCDKLTTVTVRNPLLTVGMGAFSGCTALTDFNYAAGATVGEFGAQAFYNDTALKTFKLPNNGVTLGGYCFYKCDNLEELVFDVNSDITDIGGTIFQDTNLSKFTVSSENQKYSVSADGRFLLSKDGKTIVFVALGESNTATQSLIDYGTLVIGEEYDEIAPGAFVGVNVKSVEIKNPNMKIGKYAFANNSSIQTLILPENGNVGIDEFAFAYAANLKEVQNLESAKTIAQYAFRSTGVTKVAIGNDATVGEGAFFESGVITLNIGRNTEIGLGAFQNCTSLQRVNFPTLGEGESANVTLGIACFANDTALYATGNGDSFSLKNITNEVPTQAFYGCTALRAIDLTGVVAIGNAAFADCSNIGAVTLSEGLTTIGDGAFGNYSSSGSSPVFTEIVIPSTVREIGNNAFMNCKKLTTVTIPEGVTFVAGEAKDADDPSMIHLNGNFVFYGCTALTSVTLPDSVTRIGKYMFATCEALNDINLGKITEIDEYAFTQVANPDNGPSLRSVDLSSVVTIGEAAFARNSVLRIDIVAPELKEVGAYAFMNTGITGFNAPALEKIGTFAFNNATRLSSFAFRSNVQSVGEAAFVGATSLSKFTDYSGRTTADVNSYLKIVDGVLYTRMKSGDWQLTAVPAAMNIDTLEVLEGTTRIATYAGNENKYIEVIVLPTSLKLIGAFAFYGYDGLLDGEVEFRSYAAPALEDAANALKLAESDPQYELLKSVYDLFGQQLNYTNFVDLVGKQKAIRMRLPKNETLEGYDSLVYEAYFGKVANAKRSNYEAMDKSMSQFIEYANEVVKLGGVDNVTINDETLVNKAVAAYNAVKQDPVQFGYTTAAWNKLYSAVFEAKAKINAIRLSQATEKVRTLAAKLTADDFPTVFTMDKLEFLKGISAEIDELEAADRALLDLTKYNALVESFGDYVASVNNEAGTIKDVANKGVASAAAVAAAVTGVAAAIVATLKRVLF